MNMKVLVVSFLDVVVLFTFFSSLFNFQNGTTDIDVNLQRLLLSWGVQMLAHARVFSLNFIKLSGHFLVCIAVFISLLAVESAAFYPQESRMLVEHIITGYFFANVFAFCAAIITKNVLESLFFPTHPRSLLGVYKYIFDHLFDVHANSNGVNQRDSYFRSQLTIQKDSDNVN